MISSGEWKEIQETFHAVIELPESQRISYINQLNQSDEFKNQLKQLIQADCKSSSQIKNLKSNISEIMSDVTFPNIENYDITEKIGFGGMGEVFKARDLKLSRDVAIKILHPHRSQDHKSQQRFLREARASAKIRHENICPIFDVSSTENGMQYIVSAFCEGESLAQKINNKSLSYKEIFSIFEQLLNALSVAHAKGIIHRDLKPDNIIVDKDNRIQLVDFGIAKNYDDLQTQSGEVLGTPDYMSPEQFRGEAFDYRSDIWSCGILLFEMLEGKTPYKGKTAPEIIYTMLHQSITIPLDENNPNYPFYILIQNCLQVDKSLRPVSIDNVLQMLLEAKSSFHDQSIFSDYPKYNTVDKFTSASNTQHIITNTNHSVVVLSLNIIEETIDEPLFKKIGSIVSKYKGFIQKTTKDSKLSSLQVLFGYPLADELKIENAMHCGNQFIDVLNNNELSYRLLADINDIVEDQNKFSTEILNNKILYRSEKLIMQLNETGLWITELFKNRLRDKQTAEHLSETTLETTDNENNKVLCHLLSNAGTSINHEPVTHSRFIGRDSQLSFLLENWEQAKEGDQQRILISGEAGIGKSRLIYELIKEIKDYKEVNLIELDCSPYEKASSYFPFLDYLDKQIDNKHYKDKDHLLHFLETKVNPSTELEKLLFLKLMNFPLSPENEAILPIGDLLNKQYQDLILRILSYKNENQTSLIVIEDLHWADTATGIILEKLLQPSSTSQSLVVMSSRPEFKPNWLSNLVTSNLYLSKLRSSQTEHLLKSLIEDATQNKPHISISNDLEQLLPELIERTGGNPLFIEEMAKIFLDLDSQNSKITQHIPETIQDSLISRLERIGISQTLAHFASVIGRDFNLDLLRQSYSISEAEFKQQLHTLTQADIIHCMDGKEQYRFKHALIRDAAYQMITADSRESLHQNLAKTLETHYEETVEKQPELLAQHWEAAGNIENAIDYWLIAAERNIHLSATRECIEISNHIVEIADNNFEKELAKVFKLKAHMRKGPAFMAKYGYADERVYEVYSEALELCEELDERDSKILILYGLWTYYCVKAEHIKAQKITQDMLELSDQMTPFEKCGAHFVTGMTLFYLGQFETSQTHFSQALRFHLKDDERRHIFLFGHDLKVVIQSYQAWNESFLGNIEQAIHNSNEAIRNARKRKHPFSLTYALSFSAWLHLNLGQTDNAETLIEESIDICKKYDIAVFLGLSMSLKALILFSQGEVEQGNKTMNEAEDIYFSTGSLLFIPSFLTAKAEVSLLLKDIESAEALLGQSLQIIESTSEKFGMAATLALRAVVHSHKQETKEAGELMQSVYKIIASQKSLGLKAILEQKGIPFDA